MKKHVNLININQPIGTFYVGKMPVQDLLDIYIVNRRTQEGGIQRELKTKRLKDISSFCSDPDSTFPTPIIIAVKESDKVNLISEHGRFVLEYEDSERFAEIIDGQHRIEGINKAHINEEYELMVVFMFNLEEEEKAYVFSTINSNQEKVSKDLIYDLFELSKTRSPQKTCHEIARIMNSDINSPFYKRLKMLGRIENGTESLSQGTFINHLLKYISSKPNEDMRLIKQKKEIVLNKNLPLQQYFLENKDEVILKILLNYFNAVKEVFPKEWGKPEKFILSKTTGYGALMKAFRKYYFVGLEKKTLAKDFFYEKFILVKEKLDNEGVKLTSEFFASGEKEQKKLAKYFESVLDSE